MCDACIGWLRRRGVLDAPQALLSEATLARRAARRREVYIAVAATAPGATGAIGAAAGAPTECPTVAHDEWAMFAGDVPAYAPTALPLREVRQSAARRCQERQVRKDNIAKRLPFLTSSEAELHAPPRLRAAAARNVELAREGLQAVLENRLSEPHWSSGQRALDCSLADAAALEAALSPGEGRRQMRRRHSNRY
jgi:hypothetical protein